MSIRGTPTSASTTHPAPQASVSPQTLAETTQTPTHRMRVLPGTKDPLPKSMTRPPGRVRQRLEDWLSRTSRKSETKSLIVPIAVRRGDVSGPQRAPTITGAHETLFRTTAPDEKRSTPDDGKPFFSRKQPRVDGSKAPPVRSDLSVDCGRAPDVTAATGLLPDIAAIVSDYAREPLTEGETWALSVCQAPPIDEDHIRKQLNEHLLIPGVAQMAEDYVGIKMCKVHHQGIIYDLPPGSRKIRKEHIHTGPVFLFPHAAGASPFAATVIGRGLGGMIVMTRDEPPPGVALAGPEGPLLIPVKGGFLWEMDAGREPVLTGYDAYREPGGWLDRCDPIPQDVSATDPSKWKKRAVQELANRASADIGNALRHQHAQAYGVDLESVGDNPRMLLESLQIRRLVAEKRSFIAPAKYSQSSLYSLEWNVHQGMYLVYEDNVEKPIFGRGMIMAALNVKNVLLASYNPADGGRGGATRLGNIWVHFFSSDDLRGMHAFKEETTGKGKVLDPDFQLLAGLTMKEVANFILCTPLERAKRSWNEVLKDLAERGTTFEKRLRDQLRAVQVSGDWYDVGIHRVVCHEPCHLDGTQLKVKVFRPGELCDWLFHNSTGFEHVAPCTALLKEGATDGAKAVYARGGYIYEFAVPAAPSKASAKK